MEHVAIVERLLWDWYVHVPSIGCGTEVTDPRRAHDAAVRLVVSATGVPADEVEVSLRQVSSCDVLVPAPPAPVEVRHVDGCWLPGEHTGWLRQLDGSWRSLVRYDAAGARWERPVTAAQVRPLRVLATTTS